MAQLVTPVDSGWSSAYNVDAAAMSPHYATGITVSTPVAGATSYSASNLVASNFVPKGVG